MREAQLYDRLPENMVRCRLCRHCCLIAPGSRGHCHVRENRSGTLVSLVYGRVVAEHVDPVEKKPLFHFLPGSRTYSIATVGCNFSCLHCQNHSIAQFVPGANSSVPGNLLEPEEIVARALQAGCSSISYTYTEPTIFFEYALDIARLAHQAGLKNIFVTNGYITSEALDRIAPFIDAANIDLKGFSDDFYRRIVGARLDQVLECINDYFRRGIWLEITTLIIPNENDDQQQLEAIASYISHELGPYVPWHVSRFFPQHKLLDHPATPAEDIVSASRIGKTAGLQYVYEGNLAGGQENTVCPACSAVVIERNGYAVTGRAFQDGQCLKCHGKLQGVWGNQP